MAKKVVKIYRSRMQIEESFRDVKSPRFGLSLTYHRTASVKRLQVLLLIATLALMVLWILGMAVILLKNIISFKQTQSVTKKSYPLFLLDCRWCLKQRYVYHVMISQQHGSNLLFYKDVNGGTNFVGIAQTPTPLIL